MRKKLLKTSLAFMLSIATIITTSIPSYAMEVNEGSGAEYKTITNKLEEMLPEEEIKEVNTIEELDTKDVAVKDNDQSSTSIFKSCRLIVYSDDMAFKDELGRDNIKSVQKLVDINAYIVTYASIKDTEKAYNDFVAQGVEVEIDMVSDTPEEVVNKDEESNDVDAEDVVATNENKDTKSEDELNHEREDEKKSIVVAILDTGLNDGEEIFTDRIVEGKNFVDDSNDTVDKNGHGTAMSRIVLTNMSNTNLEQTEVDKIESYILPIKVLNDEGKGTTLSAYKGIKYAIEKKVDVINLSLSGIGHSKLLESAINEAYNNNIPVVVSSGNDNKEITDYTPANIESAFTIGSADVTVNENEEVDYVKAPYSNYGSDTNSIDYVTNGNYEYKRVIKDEEVTTTTNGTSVSAAYVTSFIAMLKQMALEDEDDSNDMLKMSDIDASLNNSVIALDNEKYFGRGYLSKDNIKLTFANQKKEEIKEVEEILPEEENIELKTTAGSYAVGIRRITSTYGETFHTDHGESVTVPHNNYVVFDHVDGSTVGNYRWHGTDTREAWKSAINLSKFVARDSIAEFHLYSDITIDFTNANLITNSNLRTEYCSGWDFYLVSERGKCKLTAKGTTTGALFSTNGVHLHSVTINDQRNTKKAVAIAAPLYSLDLQNAQLNMQEGSSDTIAQLYNTGAAAIDMKAAILDGSNKSQYGLRVKAGWGGKATSCEFRSCSQYGVYNETTTKIELLGCDSHGNKYGIYNSGPLDITGTDGKYYGNTTAGIHNSSGKTITMTGGAIKSNSKGIINQGTFDHKGGTNNENNGVGLDNSGTYTLSGSGSIGANKGTGVVNSGKFTMNDGGVNSNTGNGIENASNKTVELKGGKVESNKKAGVVNAGILKLSGGPIIDYNKTDGVTNTGTMTMTDGAIYSNEAYGVNNTGTFTFTAGQIYSNQGTKPTSDTCNVGVYQNGTFTIGGSARVHNNSVYLPSAKYVKQDSGTFTGQAILTTSTDDRTVGRQLVTGSSSASTSKYSLAYGNSGGITNGYSVKDSDGSSFTGTAVGIRSGANNGMTSTSQYLSGKYGIIYNMNKSTYPDISPNPTSYSKTEFWWKEAVTGKFSNTPKDKNEGYDFVEWNTKANGSGTGYTSDNAFSKGTLTGNVTYYAIWEELSQEWYKVHYDHNNGYGDTSNPDQECRRDKIYRFYEAPSRYKTASITFNPDGGSDITSVNGATYKGINSFISQKTFRGWVKEGTTALKTPNSTFRNLGETDETVTMTGSWATTTITLPPSERPDYRFKGWEIEGGDGTVYPAGSKFTPTNDEPITFVAVWEWIERYDVLYNHNNGYGDTTLQNCERGLDYEYATAPSRWTTAQIVFDPAGGGNITELGNTDYVDKNVFNTQKTFRGWTREGETARHFPGATFSNLGLDGETVIMNANWESKPIKMPVSYNGDYILVGWQIPGEEKIYAPGETYTPPLDGVVPFVAIWQAIDRTVTYNANGAVNADGTLVPNTTVDKPAPLSDPFTLAPGTVAGGKRLVVDTVYIKGNIGNSLVQDTTANNNSSSTQFRAKAGDIINNLGYSNTLAKFVGWSKEPYGTAYTGDVVIPSSYLWGDFAYLMTDYTFYAIWDKFPQIMAGDIVVTDPSTVTEQDLINRITAIDEEDGDISNKVRVLNYPEIMNAISTSNEFTVIYEVTDSAGNTTRAFSIIKVQEEYDGKSLPVITSQVRCITRHAYNTRDESKGGCLNNSPWYNDPAYATELISCFDNLDNNTSIASYTLTKKDREEITEYMHDGSGKVIKPNILHNQLALQYIVEHYMDDAHKTKGEKTFEDSNVMFIRMSGDRLKENYERKLERQKELNNNMNLNRIYI